MRVNCVCTPGSRTAKQPTCTDIFLLLHFHSPFSLDSATHTSLFVRSTCTHCMALPFLPTGPVSVHHGLINYEDTTAKCRHLKKLTCKGTLRQVFIRVYRLEGDTVSHIGIFDPALWTIAPFPFSLVQLSPLPSPLSVWICILYTRIQWGRRALPFLPTGPVSVHPELQQEHPFFLPLSPALCDIPIQYCSAVILIFFWENGEEQGRYGC
jgi:hypothetical protein